MWCVCACMWNRCGECSVYVHVCVWCVECVRDVECMRECCVYVCVVCDVWRCGGVCVCGVYVRVCAECECDQKHTSLLLGPFTEYTRRQTAHTSLPWDCSPQETDYTERPTPGIPFGVRGCVWCVECVEWSVWSGVCVHVCGIYAESAVCMCMCVCGVHVVCGVCGCGVCGVLSVCVM